ncbi:MAG TPA: cytochrome c oxidase assembly factor Coa1 family protein, partial [Nitrospira sp.]|nr:cytochrome c oxidase assembly factor Coa1 family protein [Nitrospira sp.]
MNCNGCGVELEPSEDQVNATVDQVLSASLQDARKSGGVCPLCGHSKYVPYSHRKSVLFGLLVACMLSLGVVTLIFLQSRKTDRSAVVDAAVARMNGNADIRRIIGLPIKADPGIEGGVRRDETGWKEARLVFPIHGPAGHGQVEVIAGKSSAEVWVFTTFEIDFEQQLKKLDLISGRVTEYDPAAYVDVHTQAAILPEYSHGVVPAARFDGTFPCVAASVMGSSVSAQFGKCAMPVAAANAVDRFEADLRDGNFVLRETDLTLSDVFDVPLTRSYRSNDWTSSSSPHAFGRNSNHPYDIAPVGSRNPYTYQMLILEDGEFLYFDRISKGTGYADALYMHTETSTRFNKATQQWNGNGWTMKLADGSEILFPESYNARNRAQGAPTEMRDADGNRLRLIRDGKRNLQQVLTPHGHWMKFTYDGLDRISRAENDRGDWARYEYNSDGMLTDVASSSGRHRHFDYQGVLMTRITDEAGHVLVQNTYHRGLLMRQQ